MEHHHRNSEFSHEKWWIFPMINGGSFHSFLYVYQARSTNLDHDYMLSQLPARPRKGRFGGWDRVRQDGLGCHKSVARRGFV